MAKYIEVVVCSDKITYTSDGIKCYILWYRKWIRKLNLFNDLDKKFRGEEHLSDKTFRKEFEMNSAILFIHCSTKIKAIMPFRTEVMKTLKVLRIA